jgi:hypothetical protein
LTARCCVFACSPLELRTITVDLLPWGSIVDGGALNNTQLALGQGGELRLSVCDLPGPSPIVAGLHIDLLFRAEATGLSIAGHCAVTLPVLLPSQARGLRCVLTVCDVCFAAPSLGEFEHGEHFPAELGHRSLSRPHYQRVRVAVSD